MQSAQQPAPTAKSPRMKKHLQESLQNEPKKQVSDDNNPLAKLSTMGSAESKMGPADMSASPTLTDEGAFKSVGSHAKKASIEDPSMANKNLPTDLRGEYSVRTLEALNQFSKYTRYTITDQLDLRCEFDLPRFRDLTDTKPISLHEDHQNFLWF